jgi:hypothetical protein
MRIAEGRVFIRSVSDRGDKQAIWKDAEQSLENFLNNI